MNLKDKTFLTELEHLNKKNILSFFEKYRDFNLTTNNWADQIEIIKKLNSLYEPNLNKNYNIKLIKNHIINKYLINMYVSQNKFKELNKTFRKHLEIFPKELKFIKDSDNQLNNFFLLEKITFLVNNYKLFMSIYELNINKISEQNMYSLFSKNYDDLFLLIENNSNPEKTIFLNDNNKMEILTEFYQNYFFKLSSDRFILKEQKNTIDKDKMDLLLKSKYGDQIIEKYFGFSNIMGNILKNKNQSIVEYREELLTNNSSKKEIIDLKINH